MMKKFISIMLIFIMSLCFVSCSGENENENTVSTTAASTKNEETVDMTEYVLDNPDTDSFTRKDYLTDKGKEIYDGLYEAVLNFENYTYLCDDTDKAEDYLNKFSNILSYYVLVDHPEIFWTEGGFIVASSTVDENGNSKLVFQLSFGCNKEDVEVYKKEIDDKVNAIVKNAPKTNDYEKVLYVYNWITDNTVYLDRPMITVGQNLDYSMYNLLINGESNCNGYSKTLSYIMRKMDIPCTMAIGECEGGTLHGWNIIKLDKENYHFDATWDDKYNKYSLTGTTESSGHSYFGVTDEEIYESRQLIPYFFAPKCNSDKYNYFVYNDLYFNEVSDDVFAKATKFSVDNNIKAVEMKFSSPELLEEAIKYISDENNNLYNILTDNGYEIGLNYSYSSIEEMNVLTIIN